MIRRVLPLFLCAWSTLPATAQSQQWRAMDYGSLLTATIELAPENVVCKGVSVRLDEGDGGVMRGRVFLTFDTDTLRCAGAWTGAGMIDGKNLVYDGTHAAHSSILGQVLFLNESGPGWADPRTGQFADQRLRGTDGVCYGPLARDWGHWRGLYRHGNQVVFVYSVGTTEVLEMPAVEYVDGKPVVTRTLNLGPRSQDLVLAVARDPERPLQWRDPPDATGYPLAVFARRPVAGESDGVIPRGDGFPFDGHTYFQVDNGAAFDMTNHDFTITARFRTNKGGTLFAQAPPDGDWAPNGKTWLLLPQQVGNVLQGGIVQLPIPPTPTGIHRGRFHPIDHQLYVAGLFGWSSDKTQFGGWYRIRYTGQLILLPEALAVTRDGVLLEFPVPLEAEQAARPDAYAVARWEYRRTATYGSDDYRISDGKPGRDRVTVTAVSMSLDRRAVFLHIPDMQPCMQMRVRYQVPAADGTPLTGTVDHTIRVLPATDAGLRQRFGDALHPVIVSPQGPAIVAATMPGAVLRLQAREGDALRTDMRRVRTIALRNAPGQRVSTQLEPGPFTATWDGAVEVELATEARFQAELIGQIELWVNGTQVLAGNADRQTTLVSEPVLLQAGPGTLGVRLVSRADGEAQLRLCWSRPGKIQSLIAPNHVRHYPAGTAGLADYEAVRQGQWELDRHHCRQCHAAPPAMPTASDDTEPMRDRPSLANGGDRFAPAWLAAWLAQPATLRNRLTMPRLLADTAAGRQDAADIAAYLMSLRSAGGPALTATATATTTSDPPADQRIEQGLILYEDLGCIGCHHFESPEAGDPYERVSLRYVAAKFQPGALVAFLRATHAHYRWRAMPDFSLTESEAAALAAYIRDNGSALPGPLINAGDATRGKTLFTDRLCSNCHVTRAEERETTPAQQPLAAFHDPTRGCLADNPPARGAAPEYSFPIATRDALRAWLVSDERSRVAPVPAAAAQLLVHELRCAVCHRRDGDAPDLPEILAEEGEQGRVPRMPPTLTWTGEKLNTDWLTNMLAGDLSYRVRPWLQARMPSLPAQAALLASGLAAEHGVSVHREPPPASSPQLAQIGQQLVNKDRGFYCLQCHALPNQPPEAPFESRGIDFVYVPDRLRNSFYRQWLRNPPQFEPTTPMPQFSTDGTTTDIKDVFDGDAQQQFDTIWAFLLQVKQDRR